MDIWNTLNECLFDGKLDAYAKKEEECCVQRPEYHVIGAIAGHFDGVVGIITQHGSEIRSYVLELFPTNKEIKVIRCVVQRDANSSCIHKGSSAELTVELFESLGLSLSLISRQPGSI